MKALSYSIIVPIFNEFDNIDELFKRLSAVMDKIDHRYEVIFINDGSRDESLFLLKNLNSSDRRVKIISLSRNFGHQTAINAGLRFSSGEAVIIMDGDLQDPPEIIPRLIEKKEQGYEVVYAVRENRKENLFKRSAYKIFYRLLKSMSNIEIPLDAGDFCVMDRKVVDLLNSMPERHKFIRGMRSWVGFRQTGVKFDRGRRFAGKPKYSLAKLTHLALDGLFSFSEAPLKLATVTGVLVSGLSLLFSLYVVLNYYLGLYPYFMNMSPGWASLIVSITFLGGIQLITIGILGEYIGRVFGEVKHRMHFVVDELVGFENKDYGNSQSNGNNPRL